MKSYKKYGKSSQKSPRKSSGPRRLTKWNRAVKRAYQEGIKGGLRNKAFVAKVRAIASTM
jgi:hypothetical protein